MGVSKLLHDLKCESIQAVGHKQSKTLYVVLNTINELDYKHGDKPPHYHRVQTTRSNILICFYMCPIKNLLMPATLQPYFIHLQL